MALVITIIVLLILAGISIGMLTGDNGIINNAGNAKEQTEIASEKEVIDQATIEAMGRNKRGNLIEEEFQEAMDRNTKEGDTEVTDIGDQFEVYFKESNRYYMVDKNGSILDYEIAVTDPYPGDITKDETGNTLTGDSEEDAYQINCIEDLVAFSNMVNNTGKMFKDGKLVDVDKSYDMYKKYIVLTKNLNFKSRASYIDSKRTDFGDINGDNTDGNILMNDLITGTGFNPIGDSTKAFRGIFNGNDHHIYNLYKSSLFGGTHSSTIMNIKVHGIEGYKNDYGIIKRINGGGGSVQVINCINYMDVSSNDNNAGIVSYSNSTSELRIINCINYGNIDGGNYGVGGILGNTNGSSKITIENSYNFGEINFSSPGISYSGCGGIIGLNQFNIKLELKNCFNIGNIKGKAVYNGNIIGNPREATISLDHIYNIDNGLSVIGRNKEFEGKIENKTKEEMKTQQFIDLLNNYLEDGEYPNLWSKWKLGEDGYPTFE